VHIHVFIHAAEVSALMEIHFRRSMYIYIYIYISMCLIIVCTNKWKLLCFGLRQLNYIISSELRLDHDISQT
jgi:hypothetical protein